MLFVIYQNFQIPKMKETLMHYLCGVWNLLLKLILIVIIIECSYKKIYYALIFVLFSILKRFNVVFFVSYDCMLQSGQTKELYFGSIENIIYEKLFFKYTSTNLRLYHDDEEMTIWFFVYSNIEFLICMCSSVHNNIYSVMNQH